MALVISNLVTTKMLIICIALKKNYTLLFWSNLLPVSKGTALWQTEHKVNFECPNEIKFYAKKQKHYSYQNKTLQQRIHLQYPRAIVQITRTQ
jgi:hypothetical protein